MKNVYWRATLAALLYLVMQALLGGLLSVFMLFSKPDSPALLAVVGTLLGAVATSLILWWRKMVRLPESFSTAHVRWPLALLAIVGVILGIIATDLLGEQINLPNLIEAEMMEMARLPLGVLTIAVVGPVAEELIFREAAEGSMLRAGVRPWKAIVFSAFLFGIIHLNPAQVFFAFIIGLMLGLIYYCTGSVVLTSLLHILNNSVAVVEMNLLGEQAKDFTYTEWLGLGTAGTWILITTLVIASAVLLWKYWKMSMAHEEEHETAL